MQYLYIYFIFVFTGIFFDLLSLILINALSFEVEEVSIFMGPKLFSKTIGNTEFSLKAIPYGSYIKLKDTFIEASRFAKILAIYLPKILLLVVAFYMINTSQNYVYIMSGKLLILVNGLSVFISIIFNKGHVF